MHMASSGISWWAQALRAKLSQLDAQKDCWELVFYWGRPSMHSGAKKRLQEPSRSQRPGAQAAVCQLLFRPKRSKPPKVPAQGGQFLQPPPPAAAAFATATATAPTLRLGLFLPRFYSYCIPLLLLSNYSSCCCYHAYNYEYAYSHGANTPTTGLQPRLPLLPLCFNCYSYQYRSNLAAAVSIHCHFSGRS